jgi:tetratricopeptide (TPR) repeat protein
MIGRAFARAGLILLCLYLLALGGTFNGVVLPAARWIGVIGAGVLALAWGIGRRNAPSPMRTPLDGAILLGVGAIALSFALNLDVWRRSLSGIWFIGLYIGVWVVVYDLIIRRVIARRTLVDALLIAGVVIVAFGYLQLRTWVSIDLGRALAGMIDFSPPRTVSTFGNPNSLAAFLVMLLPLIAARALSTGRGGRVVLALYFAVTGGLLVLTTSRGGWLGAAAGVFTVGLGTLWLGDGRAWWARRTQIARIGIGIVGVAVVIGMVGAVIVSLGWSGRSFNTRTWIYDAAARTFAAQPIAGSGLYTFGRDLARVHGMPPYEPHAHAHNIGLHVAAELGIVGVIALIVLMIALARAFLRALQAQRVRLRSSEAWITIGTFGSAVGFGVHHLFDVPSMMPVIALTLIALCAVGIAVPRPDSLPPAIRSRIPIRAWDTAGLWIALIASGVWSAATYDVYWRGVQESVANMGDLASDQLLPLQDVIAADPNQPAYHYAQGMLLALSDHTAGTTAHADSSRAAFMNFTTLEPDYAMGWVNLAAMRAASGDSAGALAAWENAGRRAHQAWSIQYQWGVYAEQIGDAVYARIAYERTLIANPDVRLHPDWNASPIRAALDPDSPPLTGAGIMLSRLIAGDPDGAYTAWMESRYRAEPPSTMIRYSIDALIAAERGNLDGARALWERGRPAIYLYEDRAWDVLLAARLGIAGASYADVMPALEVEGVAADWESGANIFYGQFLTLAIPRVFVPQAQIDRSYTSALLAAAVDWLDADPSPPTPTRQP